MTWTTTMKTTPTAPNGSEILSKAECSQPDTLTTGIFETFYQASLWDTDDAISSPESEYGLSPSKKPGSFENAGRDRAHANLSARQAKALGLTTSGTYGRTGSGSLRFAVLSASLASKYRDVTRCVGSTLYRLTWKALATPSGRSMRQLRASALRTSAKGFTGWLAPKLPSGGAQSERLTPGGGLRKLEDQTLLSGWRAPQASDGEGGVMEIRPGTTGKYKLRYEAPLAGWATATVNDSKQGSGESQNNRDGLTGEARLTAFILMPDGSIAPTDSGGQLDPRHSAWLQGIPETWANFAPTETRSVLLKQKHSSGVA